MLDSVFASPAYRWAEEPPLLRLLREWWDRLTGWLDGLRAGNPAAFRLFVFACSSRWCWCWRTARGSCGGRCAAPPPPDEAAPRPPRARSRDAAWYFREADRAAAAGRTGDALQLAFVGLALTLDAQGLLRYHASKTPAECAREARLAREDRERLRALVRALYAHVFGGRPLRARTTTVAGATTSRRPWHAPAH